MSEFVYYEEEQEVRYAGLTATCIINNGMGEGTLTDEQVNVMGKAMVLLFTKLREMGEI